jgi:hypothetical protein
LHGQRLFHRGWNYTLEYQAGPSTGLGTGQWRAYGFSRARAALRELEDNG